MQRDRRRCDAATIALPTVTDRANWAAIAPTPAIPGWWVWPGRAGGNVSSGPVCKSGLDAGQGRVGSDPSADAAACPRNRAARSQRAPGRGASSRDSLTGLLNRQGLERLLDELLDNGPRERMAVLYCDIDHFSRVNTSLDRDAGDELMVALARHLTGRLPRGCTPARLSGEDFVIVCPDVAALACPRSSVLPAPGHVASAKTAHTPALWTGTPASEVDRHA